MSCSAGVEVAAQGFTNDVGGGYAVPFGSLGDLIVEFWIETDGLDGRRACAAERGSSALAAAGDELGGVVAAFGFVGKGVDVGVGDDASGWGSSCGHGWSSFRYFGLLGMEWMMISSGVR